MSAIDGLILIFIAIEDICDAPQVSAYTPGTDNQRKQFEGVELIPSKPRGIK